MAVASGLPMKIGSVRPSPSVSWSRSTGVFDCRSTRTARRSTRTTYRNVAPDSGLALPPQVLPERLTEQRGSHRLAEGRQLVCPLDGPLPRFGVPLAQERDNDLLDQAHLAVGR